MPQLTISATIQGRMAKKIDILLAIRQLRNDIMAGSRNGRGAREKLKYRCDEVEKLPFRGTEWASRNMPDPLFPTERGHSVKIVPRRGLTGWVVSLTGKKILGIISNMKDDETTRAELTRITKADWWKKKAHASTKKRRFK
jgi:hypothetical protein